MDRDLVERARRGDREAFAVLVHQVSDALYAVAFRILRDTGLHGWAGGGLASLNPTTGESAVFTTKQGLPDDSVWCVAGDVEGRVWVGTGAGLGRYKTGQWEDFRGRLPARSS